MITKYFITKIEYNLHSEEVIKVINSVEGIAGNENDFFPLYKYIPQEYIFYTDQELELNISAWRGAFQWGYSIQFIYYLIRARVGQ